MAARFMCEWDRSTAVECDRGTLEKPALDKTTGIFHSS